MRTITLLASLGLLLLTACGETQRPEESSPALDTVYGDERGTPDQTERTLPVPEDAPSVLFVGDSIAAGLHVHPSQAFPAILQRRFQVAGPAFRLWDAHESGMTTSGAKARLEFVLKHRKPDVIVFEIGGNDGLRGVDLATVRANLSAMIESAHAIGARVLLLGVRIPPSYGDYAQAFDALYPELAEQHQTAFVPFWMRGVGGVPEMNVADGLHPTPEGHEKLADNIADALREVLQGL